MTDDERSRITNMHREAGSVPVRKLMTFFLPPDDTIPEPVAVWNTEPESQQMLLARLRATFAAPVPDEDMEDSR